MDLFPFSQVREKQDEMMEASRKAINEGKSLVAHAPTGLGKCVSGETQVLTSEGICRIEELEENHVCCNSFDEELSSSLSGAQYIKKSEQELRAIKTYTGREVKVTGDHKLLRLKEGDVEWVKSENLEEGDFIASPRSLELPEIDFRFTLADVSKGDNVRVTVSPGLGEVIEDIKNSLEMDDREISDYLEIPRSNLTSMRTSRPVKACHVKKVVKESARELESFSIERVSRSNRNTISLPEIDEDFSYFLGLMLGDGGIFGERETISMTTQDKEVEQFFREKMEEFGSSVREVHGDDYGYKSNNKSLAWFLNKLGLPRGKKENFGVPDCVLTSKENLSAFLTGLLDTDGSVDNQGKVEFSTKSRQLADQLIVLFPLFGIRPTRKEKDYDGSTYQRLFISNQRGLERLAEQVGFRIQRKQERLEDAIDRQHNPNKDIIPEIQDLIKKAREKSEVEYSRKTLRRRLESYETGARRPSREGLKEILEELGFENNQETRKIRKLITSDVFWDKISSVEKEDKERVYDLSVPNNHNFSANNLVLHNTAATLTPAIEYAKQNNKKVFFLTPRHSQHSIAVETVKKMQDRHDVELTVVDLLGKKWLCNVDGVEEMSSRDFKDYCQTLRDEERCDYYTAMYDMGEHQLKDEAKKRLEKLEGDPKHAEDFKTSVSSFCPYYMMMELTRKSDLIIADYFHIFHPGVRETLFERAGVDPEDAILIVDEAHNLPSRTRSLFSSSLSIPQLDNAITEAEKFGFYEEEEKLERLRNAVKSLAADNFEAGSHEEKVEKRELKEPVSNIRDYGELIVDLEAVAEEVTEEREKSYCSGVARFLENWDGEDNGFFRCIKRTRSSSGNRYIEVKYTCLDPQVSTKEPLNDAHASILMSGTLTPQKMYVDLLGLEPGTITRAFKSPFPDENQLNLMVPTVTTKYSERDDSMYQKYAWYLAKSFEALEGNAGVFFPSYKFMHRIKEILEEKSSRKLFVEKQSMNKEDKQRLFEEFAARKDSGDAVLLGVAAGSMGEGVDYPGEIMKGAFIVGLPLKRPDLETKGLINFYDYKFDKGWDYGYSYPAMNRAQQAAGRCIRSKDDKGVIVYMDERYDWSNYRKVFPPGLSLKKTRAPWQEIDEFFS